MILKISTSWCLSGSIQCVVYFLLLHYLVSAGLLIFYGLRNFDKKVKSCSFYCVHFPVRQEDLGPSKIHKWLYNRTTSLSVHTGNQSRSEGWHYEFMLRGHVPAPSRLWSREGQLMFFQVSLHFWGYTHCLFQCQSVWCWFNPGWSDVWWAASRLKLPLCR